MVAPAAPSDRWAPLAKLIGAVVAAAGGLGLTGHLLDVPFLLRPFGLGTPPSLATSASLTVLGLASVGVTGGRAVRVSSTILAAALAAYRLFGLMALLFGAAGGAPLAGVGTATALTIQAATLALVASGASSRTSLAIASALTLALASASLLAFAISVPMLARYGLEMPFLVAVALALHGAGMLAWSYYDGIAGRPRALLQFSPIVAAIAAATFFIAFAIAVEGDAAALQIALVLGAAGKLGQSVHSHLKERRGNQAAVEGAQAAQARAEDDVLRLKRAEELTSRLLQLEREARREAELGRERLFFVAEASRALTLPVDLAGTLRATADASVPRLAEWSMLVLAPDERSPARAAIAAHADPSGAAAVLAADEPLVAEGSVLALALRFGRASLLTTVRPGEETELLGLQSEKAREAARQLGIRGCAILPLRARGRSIGALLLIETCEASRWSSAPEVALAQEYADRVALAIDDAELYEEAKASLRARDEFLAIATQDLKMPLSLLDLQLESMMRSRSVLSQSPEKLERFLRNARRLTVKLSTVVEDLLDPSRITNERLTLDVSSVDLASLTCTVVARFAERAKRAGCTINLSTPDAVMGDWDAFRLEQVIANLLSNAIKYGGGQPIDIAVESDGDLARLIVHDRGPGIPPEQRANMFSLAERHVSARHYGGVGLGLYLVQRFVEAMGGSVEVASALGEGSTLTVRLPRAGAPRKEAA